MRKFWSGLLVVTFAVVSVLCVFVPQAGSEDAEKAKRVYVGVAKCRTCHKTAGQGGQYGIWQKSKHAKAYETLAGEESLKIARERGIENPQKADECVKCHITAFGVEEECLGKKYAITNGVTCEACHGPGGDYAKSATMKAIIRGEIAAASVGLVYPDEQVCVTCHNEESPVFEGFEFDAAYAKIKHTIPEERRAKYKAE
jgi:hypothetical protein